MAQGRSIIDAREVAMIQVRDVLIRRNGWNMLQVDSLDIQRGETLAVVGPNGAGKSTLLLALARLLQPSRGDILYAGESLEDLDELEYRRRISIVFQAPLLMDMTVEQNIALGLKFRGTPKNEVQTRVGEWMRQLGVESLAKRRASRLSGGEAQRVSLARAFVLEPELLLLDEPFSALDPPTRSRLIQDLYHLLEKEHRTAVFVTHNMNEAAKLGHRIAVITGGVLRQVGTLEEIKTDPADEAVAAFLHELPQ
ncbi:MAG: ATP-binding cassette domain-containing protein [Syntrophothermus sp.]